MSKKCVHGTWADLAKYGNKWLKMYMSCHALNKIYKVYKYTILCWQKLYKSGHLWKTISSLAKSFGLKVRVPRCIFIYHHKYSWQKTNHSYNVKNTFLLRQAQQTWLLKEKNRHLAKVKIWLGQITSLKIWPFHAISSKNKTPNCFHWIYPINPWRVAGS